MPLTDTEQHSIEYHLGWVQDAQALLLSGNVVAHQIISLLRHNIQRTEENKVYRVREALCECQKIQDQLKEVRGKFGAVRLGDIEYNAREAVEMLDYEYLRWTRKLADMYGGHENLYSRERQQLGGGAGMTESY